MTQAMKIRSNLSFEENGFKVSKMDYEMAIPEKQKSFIFTISSKDRVPIKQLIDKISGLGYVTKISVKS